MSHTFNLTISTPDQTVFEGEAKMIHLATEGGEMEIYGDHASLTATIAFSPVEIKTTKGKDEHYLARNGIFTFNNETNTASLLTLHCEHKTEINHQTVKEYAAFIDKQLAEGKELSDFQILYLKGEKLAVEEQLQEIE